MISRAFGRENPEQIDGTRTLDYGYDDTNQLIDDDGTAIDYDANGNRNGTGYTVAAGNRVTDDGTWTYVYDDMGQVIEKNKSGEYWTYDYDHRGQLIHASKASKHQGTPTDEVAYTYDAFGNRLERLVGEGSSITAAERFANDVPAPCQSPSTCCHRHIAGTSSEQSQISRQIYT